MKTLLIALIITSTQLSCLLQSEEKIVGSFNYSSNIEITLVHSMGGATGTDILVVYKKVKGKDEIAIAKIRDYITNDKISLLIADSSHVIVRLSNAMFKSKYDYVLDINNEIQLNGIRHLLNPGDNTPTTHLSIILSC